MANHVALRTRGWGPTGLGLGRLNHFKLTRLPLGTRPWDRALGSSWLNELAMLTE